MPSLTEHSLCLADLSLSLVQKYVWYLLALDQLPTVAERLWEKVRSQSLPIGARNRVLGFFKWLYEDPTLKKSGTLATWFESLSPSDRRTLSSHPPPSLGLSPRNAEHLHTVNDIISGLVAELRQPSLTLAQFYEIIDQKYESLAAG